VNPFRRRACSLSRLSGRRLHSVSPRCVLIWFPSAARQPSQRRPWLQRPCWRLQRAKGRLGSDQEYSRRVVMERPPSTAEWLRGNARFSPTSIATGPSYEGHIASRSDTNLGFRRLPSRSEMAARSMARATGCKPFVSIPAHTPSESGCGQNRSFSDVGSMSGLPRKRTWLGDL
jgi:hypothetical protein